MQKSDGCGCRLRPGRRELRSNAAGKNETELPPAAAASSRSGDTTQQPTAAAKSGTEVLLRDGQTKVTVPAGTPGTSVASSLLAEWIRKNPNAN